MQVTMIEGRHLTATNRKHIVAVIEQGLTSGYSKRIGYHITEQDGDTYSIRIEQNERNDYGKLVTRIQNVKVIVK